MDQLESIKQAFGEADAAGRISKDSSIRWLITEVEMLRDQVHQLIKEADQLRAVLAVDASDHCDPQHGYHSTPHKGCSLR